MIQWEIKLLKSFILPFRAAEIWIWAREDEAYCSKSFELRLEMWKGFAWARKKGRSWGKHLSTGGERRMLMAYCVGNLHSGESVWLKKDIDGVSWCRSRYLHDVSHWISVCPTVVTLPSHPKLFLSFFSPPEIWVSSTVSLSLITPHSVF